MTARIAVLAGALIVALGVAPPPARAQQYLGQLSANRHDPDSTSNPYGRYGSPYSPTSIHNPYGVYGSRFSAQSPNNPHATRAPLLFDSAGNFRGMLSANRFHPDSTSNPFGRYGSRFSPESIRNPFGAGSPYRLDSPTNPHGRGLAIVGQ